MSKKKKSAKGPEATTSTPNTAIPQVASPAMPKKATLGTPARKRAADFMSDEEDNSIGSVKLPKEGSKPVSQPAKKQKGLSPAEAAADSIDEITTNTTALSKGKPQKNKNKSSRTAPLAEKSTKVTPKEDTINTMSKKKAHDSLSTAMQIEAQGVSSKATDNDESDGSDEEVENTGGDQAPELLAGFDSDNPDAATDEGLNLDVSVPTLPNYKKTSKKLRRALEKENGEGPGTVYVGRIPHGFFEHQMRAYFSQFGKITKIRLSRNRITGASKHFAFIQFEHAEVAKIVAQAMDNYLMFGHILKCKFAPEETLHPDVWKGANRRYRKIPHNKLEKARLEKPRSKEQWAAKIAKEQEKREKKAKRLKEMGYDIEFPKMTSVDEIVRGKTDKSASFTGAEVPATDQAVAPKAAEDLVAENKQPKESKISKKKAEKAAKRDAAKANDELEDKVPAALEKNMPSAPPDKNTPPVDAGNLHSSDVVQSKSSKKRKNKERSQTATVRDSEVAKDAGAEKAEPSTHIQELTEGASKARSEDAVAKAENAPKLSNNQRKKMAKRKRLQSVDSGEGQAATKLDANTMPSIAKPAPSTAAAMPKLAHDETNPEDGVKKKSKQSASGEASDKTAKRKVELTSNINGAGDKKKKKAKSVKT